MIGERAAGKRLIPAGCNPSVRSRFFNRESLLAALVGLNPRFLPEVRPVRFDRRIEIRHLPLRRRDLGGRIGPGPVPYIPGGRSGDQAGKQQQSFAHRSPVSVLVGLFQGGDKVFRQLFRAIRLARGTRRERTDACCRNHPVANDTDALVLAASKFRPL